MVRSYRDVESASIATAPFLTEAAEAALVLLSRRGAEIHGTGVGGAELGRWTLECAGPSGTRFAFSCSGPTLPTTIPGEVIRPGDIAKDRPFVGTWRLVVKAPLVVLDLYWQADKPLRIMTFANGDWQRELAALAATRAPVALPSR